MSAHTSTRKGKRTCAVGRQKRLGATRNEAWKLREVSARKVSSEVRAHGLQPRRSRNTSQLAREAARCCGFASGERFEREGKTQSTRRREGRGEGASEDAAGDVPFTCAGRPANVGRGERWSGLEARARRHRAKSARNKERQPPVLANTAHKTSL